MGYVLRNPITAEQLQTKADNSQFQSALNSLQNALKTEETTRAEKDSDLMRDVAFLKDTLTSEIAGRADSQNQLKNDLNAEIQNRTDNFNQLKDALDAEVSNRRALESNIDTALSSFTSTLGDDISNLETSLNTETQNRTSEDNKLKNSISNLETSFNNSLSTETQNRTSEDNKLKNSISTLETSLNNSLSTEIQKLRDDTSKLADKTEINNKIASIEGTLNDFTAPTATKNGTRGFVPAPPKGTDLKILTSEGWRTAGDSSLSISTVPAPLNALTFNGNSQSPNWLNFDNKKLKIAGETSGTNVKTYTVTFTPLDIYVWADTLDQQPKSATWTIEPLKLPKPTASVTTFTYNGSTINLSVNNFNSTYISQSGNVSANAAGDYSATFKLKNTTNTKWSDNSTSDVVINWTVKSSKVDKPTATTTTFTYNGSTINLAVSGFDSEYMTKTGTTSAVDAGNYSVTYKLKNDNAKWDDGSTGDIVINWTINPLKLPKPTASVTTFTYDGDAKALSVPDFDSNFMTQTDTSATDAGSYSATFTLKDPSNTKWADGSVKNVVINWKIEPLKLAKPTASTTSFTYDGAAKSLTINDFDAEYMSQTGTTSATRAGSYSVTFKLKNTSNTKWSNGTTADVVINWTIAASKVTKPTAKVTSFTYDGSEKSISVSNFNDELMTQSGNLSGTTAGSYSVTYALKDSNNVWADGSTGNVIITWKIEPIKLTKPSANTTSFTYNGSEKSLSISNFDAEYMSQTGTTSATNAGSYSVTFKLKNTTNTKWTDGTTSNVVISWSIAPVTLTKPTVSATEFYYDNKAHSLSISNFNSSYMTKSGTESATDIGIYKLTIKLKDSNHTWTDGSSVDVVFNWKIERFKVTKPVLAISTLGYNGSNRTPDIVNINLKYMTQEGTTTAKDVGSYSVTFALIDSSHTWDDGSTTDIVINWQIVTSKILSGYSNVTLKASPRYNGQPVTLGVALVRGYDSTFQSWSGTTSATNAGTYTAYVEPATGYVWDDGSTTKKTFEWTIEPAKVTAPTMTENDFTFNFNQQTPTFKDYDASLMAATTNIKNKDAGTYTFEVFLRNKTNYTWDDGTIDNKTFTWYIRPLSVPLPVADETTFAYDGNQKELVISNYDTQTMVKPSTTDSGTPTWRATNAGSYFGALALADSNNLVWADGSTDKILIYWTIGGNYIAIPTLNTAYMFSQGMTKTHSVTVLGFDANTMTKSGTESVSNGKGATYTVTVALKDKTNTAWTDGSTTDKKLSWTVAKKKLSASQSTFTQSKSISYDGNSHSVTEAVGSIWQSFIGEFYTLTNDTASSIGTHTTTITLLESATWSDDSTAAKTINWSIDALDASLSLPSKLTFNLKAADIGVTDSNTAHKQTVNFTTDSTGDLTITSDDWHVAGINADTSQFAHYTTKVAANAGSFDVFPFGNGSTTFTVTQSADSSHQETTKTFTVTVSTPKVYFKAAEIQALTKAGTLGNYMKPGDIFYMYKSDAGSPYFAKLLGFNHNNRIEGSNRAHFTISHNNDPTVLLPPIGHYGSSGNLYEKVGTAEDSIMSLDGAPVNFLDSYILKICHKFYASMPSEWKNIINASQIKLDYYEDEGRTLAEDHHSAAIFATPIWPLSAIEIFGKIPGVDQSYWQDLASGLAQYEFFANGNSPKSARSYWLRDYVGNPKVNCYVDTNGNLQTTSNEANLCRGVLPVFVVS